MTDRILFGGALLLIVWVCLSGLSDRDAMARCLETHSYDVCHHSLYR